MSEDAGTFIVDVHKLVYSTAFWAVFGAAILFIYKLLAGYMLTNLSVELTQRRQKKEGGEEDFVVGVVKLTKGDRSSISLHDIEMRLRGPGKPAFFEMDYNRRVGWNRDTKIADEYSIAIDEKSRSFPVLRMTPRESTTFEALLTVPSTEICTIDVVIIGKIVLTDYLNPLRWFSDEIGNMGQWRASVVSLPIPPKEPGAK